MLSKATDGKKPFTSKACISADSVPKQQLKPDNRCLNDSFSTLSTFFQSVNTQISPGDITYIDLKIVKG